jgi:energy-coupling factor transporter ATP-binding protein EcfA2
MKLLRVEVEHFACLKKTAVEFGPGLNVLYGPNDLGKSTLARAIRAVLLIQHSSKVANAFREWDSDENPFVKLTIELADGRIWRVEKRFGTTGGSSMLRESNDGVHFSPFRRSREVDDEVRTRLGWGIAAPATKNAPKGLPPSFLATVLLGEQTDVAGVLRQTLDADSDESGRKKLTAALAAFAQDPLFKSILDRAQARVDEAFTTKGNKKTGRTSPFREVTDEVKRSKQLLDELKSRVDESEAVQRTLSERQDDLVDAHDALDGAIAHRDTLKRMAEQLATRKGIEEALAVAQKTFAENEAELDGLADRRKQLVDAETLASKLERRVGELENERQSLVGAKTAAEDALRRAKSDEAEHDRQLRRG